MQCNAGPGVLAFEVHEKGALNGQADQDIRLFGFHVLWEFAGTLVPCTSWIPNTF